MATKKPVKSSVESDLAADHDPQVEHQADMQGDEADISGEASDISEDGDEKELHKVMVVHDGTNINGHPLENGHVVKMTKADIDNHRARGVPLESVHEDDEREVYDVSEPYQPEEQPEEQTEEE